MVYNFDLTGYFNIKGNKFNQIMLIIKLNFVLMNVFVLNANIA